MRFETDMFLMSSDKQEPETVHVPSSEERVDSLETGRSDVEIREIPGTEGFYNAAAWETDGTTYLLGRKVEKAGEKGIPDVGSLLLLTLGQDSSIMSSKEVWQPKAGESLLEDARALPLSDGRIAFGLTSVIEEEGHYTPYPSVLITSTKELTEGTLREPKIIKIIGSGDQTTPLGEEPGSSIGKNVMAIGPNLFTFRPENDNHQLQVFEYREDGEVSHQQYINFAKDIPWAEWRIGTTMPPVWLNETEAVFPIHGINLVDGRYVYSIGSARLLKGDDGLLSVDNISHEPIIDPDLFVEMFDGDEAELHGERRVVYCCGGIPIYDNSGKLESLRLYVNVGDKRTVEVTISAAKLTEGWLSGDSFDPEQLLSKVA
jgi:hypothetical protein